MAIHIIPQPVSVRDRDGVFQCAGLPGIEHHGPFFQESALFAEQLAGDFPGTDWVKAVVICRENSGVSHKEGYRLSIRPDKIEVEASSGAGLYHGLQTLRQLILSGFSENHLRIPCAEIEDYPRFSWRGLMLDTSRHFYTVRFIKKIIDLISLHHFSVFHWHLTDDQGWRFPVPELPALIDVGSKRSDIRAEWGSVVEGHYTEDEIRDVISYAQARHIEIVPEVELPGHSSAILASYPDLGCTGGPYQVEDRYGIFEEALCAGNDRVFDFVGTVFDTLVRLFPSSYVHIGGDEVKFNRWTACPKCRKRLTELGLEEINQLQSWMTVRFARMLQERNRIAIGWDEVLEGTEKFGLPQELVVMSWRGQEGGFSASSRGHRVIMTPLTEGCYLNFKHTDNTEEPGQYGISSVSQLYHMDPVTPDMTNIQAGFVLGGQCNLWAELIYADRLAEYMLFPRICAASESFWSPRGVRNFESFIQRLPVHQKRLDHFGLLQYRGSLE